MASWVFPLPLFIDCSFIWWRNGGRLSFTYLRGRYYVHYSLRRNNSGTFFFYGEEKNISRHGPKTNLTRTSLPSELVSLAVKSFLCLSFDLWHLPGKIQIYTCGSSNMSVQLFFSLAYSIFWSNLESASCLELPYYVYECCYTDGC